ncbi:DUF1801 domain-containing protein [Arcicella rosea]|uniref:Uncharacterized protein YdhG (YjbR/CyaY superfamily) n=1 Tax=Arcicella rosea TaxID=502909 RepID=A0A841ELE1_9BACT|nr:DUF1801 domain-containing protein [Arcicella rosea]MBB6004977.1 uncharacterized protein YdhG (YjbR/CyaY superfamily) [Arcicella rosea]
MQSNAQTPDQYIEELPEDRKIAISNLRKVILENLPEGFQETMSYGMIGYVVPHSLYPSGYHCTPNLPLPFLSIASQKNFIAVYNMLVYSDPTINEWFVNEYTKYSKAKLDMGKSCIRFKKLDQIPFDLIGELASKVTVDEWINIYEAQLKR